MNVNRPTNIDLINEVHDILQDVLCDEFAVNSCPISNVIRVVYSLVENASPLHFEVAIEILDQLALHSEFSKANQCSAALDELLPENQRPFHPSVISGLWGFVGSWRCDHSGVDLILTQRTISNGVVRRALQCPVCGAMTSHIKLSPRQKKTPFSEIPLFDDNLRLEWNFWKKTTCDAIATVRSRRYVAWTDWYSNYLDSYEWGKKRQQKLDQADGVCERCGDKATEVHHLSYRNAGNEPLEDLMAICYWCHHQEHGTAPIVDRP